MSLDGYRHREPAFMADIPFKLTRDSVMGIAMSLDGYRHREPALWADIPFKLMRDSALPNCQSADRLQKPGRGTAGGTVGCAVRRIRGGRGLRMRDVRMRKMQGVKSETEGSLIIVNDQG